jgi:hypothetical protein
MQPKKQIQCHNLSPAQLKDVQRANAVDEPLEMIPANIVSDHEIKAIEKHLVHVKLENPSFNNVTGERQSKPFIQMFYPNEFDKMVNDNSFAGLTVEKIHDPRRETNIGSVNDAQTGFNTNAGTQTETPLSKMNKEQLQAKFAELYGEQAPEGTKAELLELIEEKIKFLADEKNK